jgi:zinc protease
MFLNCRAFDQDYSKRARKFMIALPKIRSRIVAAVLLGASLLVSILPGGPDCLPAGAQTSASTPAQASTSIPVQTDASAAAQTSASAAASPMPASLSPSAPAGASGGASSVARTDKADIALVPVKVSSEIGTIQELKLVNGLKVLMLEDHSFPVFSCMVFYRVGSRNENLGVTGISHLVEHLLFEKVGKFRRGEIGATIARNGGMFNGFTSDDFTVFFETLSPSKLDLALRVESERMKAGTFSTEEVQAEIKRIGTELDQEAKDSANTLAKEVRSNAFQLHPYKNPTIGWRSDVEKLTVEDARRHYKEYYQPGNATLILVGDFSAPGAISGVKKYFAGIASADLPRAPRVVEPQQRAERRLLMKFAGASDVVSMAYHAPAFLDSDTAAMAVLEKLLVSGVGGRLKSKLVEGKICTSARCSFEVKHDPGLFTVNLTGASGVPAQKITESFESVIDQLKTNPVSESELKRARNHAEYYFLTERDGPYHVAFQLGYFDCLDTWQSAFSAYSRLRSVSAADIQRVAKRYFNPECRVVGVLAGQATKTAAAALAKKETEKAAKDKDKDKGKDKDKDKGKDKDKDESKDKGASPGGPESKSGSSKSDKSKKSKDDKKSGQDKSSDKTKKDKGSHHHHHHKTAILNGIFAVPLCAYKDSDAALVTGPGVVPRLLAQKPAEGKVAATPYTPRVKQATLKNGLTIGVLETKLSPMVQIVGAVKAGEAYEPVGKRGAATLLAELINQGSTRYSRAQAVALQDELGMPPQSMVRFEPGPQWINFQSRCFSRDTSAVLGIITAALKAPSLKDEDVDHAKQLCADHLKRSPDTVKAKVERALLRGLIAPNTSFYPLDPNDKAKFLSLLKATDVREFLTQAIKPDATTIVFVGDISLAQAVELSERACEGWSGNSTAKKVLVQPNPRRLLKSSLIVDRREDTMVTLGRLVDAGVGSADYPLLLLADCALTNHPIVSRFAQKISGEISLSSSLSLEDLASDVESLPGTTVWSVDIPVVSNLMPVAVKSIQNELKRFVKGGLTPEEYSEVKLYLNGALPVRWMSSSPLAARTSLDALMLDHQADPLPELLTGIGLANVDTVNRFIRVTFKPDRSSLVMAGTKQAIGQVHGIKEEEASSEGGPARINTNGPPTGSTSATGHPLPAGTGGTGPAVKKSATPSH